MSLMPLPADIPARTTVEMIQRLASIHDEFIFTASSADGSTYRLTGADFADLIARTATVLQKQGVKAGDRVSLFFENHAGLEATALHFGVHWCGGIAIPMNTRLSDSEWDVVTTHADALLLCSEGQLLLRVAEHGDRHDIGVLDLSNGVQAHTAGVDPVTPVPVGEDDLADIMYTSGTTGTPKGVELTHANTVSCGWELHHAMQLTPRDTLQSAVPFFTSTGAHTNPMAAFITPCHYVLEPSFDQFALIERLQENKTTVYFGVPSMLTLAMRDLPLPEDLPTHLERVVFGGSVTTLESLNRLAEAFPGRGLINLYGLTEGGPGGSCIGPDDIMLKPGSVGRHGNGPNTTLAVFNEDDSPAAPNEIGEIVVRSPAVMRGYRNNPEATELALRGGWLHTSDYGYLDEDGFLWYVGRRDDLVVRGGFNVATTEVETVIAGYPGVREVAVVGILHDVLGQDIVAHIALDGPSMNWDHLIKYLSLKLADFKTPRIFVVHENLPRSPMGKILKRLLPHPDSGAIRISPLRPDDHPN